MCRIIFYQFQALIRIVIIVCYQVLEKLGLKEEQVRLLLLEMIEERTVYLGDLKW